MKLVLKERKEVNEIVGTAAAAVGIMALGAIFMLAAMSIYKVIKPIVDAIGINLNKIDKQISLASDKLPAEEKSNFDLRYRKLKDKFKKDAEVIAESGKDPEKAGKVRELPSKVLANDIRNILVLVADTRKRFPETSEDLAKTEENLKTIFDRVKKLDFMVLISSKEQPNSLWNKVISADPKLNKLDDKQLATLTNLLSDTINWELSRQADYTKSVGTVEAK